MPIVERIGRAPASSLFMCATLGDRLGLPRIRRAPHVARRAERPPGGRPPLDPLHLSNLVCSAANKVYM